MKSNPVGDYPPSVRQAGPFQFRLRSLFVVMTLAAVLTIPVQGWVTSYIEPLRQPAPASLPTLGFTTNNTRVQVPDGGFVLIGHIKRDTRPIFEQDKQRAAVAPKKSSIRPIAVNR